MRNGLRFDEVAYYSWFNPRVSAGRRRELGGAVFLADGFVASMRRRAVARGSHALVESHLVAKFERRHSPASARGGQSARQNQAGGENMTNHLAASSAELNPIPAALIPSAQELWQRYHQQKVEPDVENALVVKYLPLVSSAVARLAMTLPDHVDRDDLQSVGLIGLLQALRNFDPTCGTSFETYARMRVRGAMLDELRRMDWAPRSVHEKARKIQAALLQLEQQLGKTPTDAQMAKALKISVADYVSLLNEVKPAAFVCLDALNSTDENDGGSLYEIIGNEAAENPVEETSQHELKKVIFARLKELPPIQQKVLALYYIEDMHLREIAEAFGLTESRICQIHAQAILAIRAYVQRLESGLVKRTATVSQP
jgi:RNA polymerase sigma factor FliA